MKAFLKSLPIIGPVVTSAGKLRWRYLHWRADPARHLRRLLAGRKDLYVVQIGSNDGSTTDPIHSLLKANRSWKALLVEPVPFVFERLRKSYSENPNVRFANVAVTEQAGVSDFYYVDASAKDHVPDLPLWFDQLGSFDREHITRHLGEEFERFTVSTPVSTVPLPELLDLNDVTRIDLLHIDTEGHDWIILRQLDLTRFRPDVILFEHKHLSKDEKREAVAFLEPNYRVTDLGGDFLCRRAS